MDRTLLTHSHVLPPRVQGQLAKAKEAGIVLVLATARSPAGARPYAERIKPDWMICFNGGWTGTPAGGAAARVHALPRELALEAMAAALHAGLIPMWFTEDGIYVLDDDQISRREAAITKEPLFVAQSLNELPGAPAKIMCVAGDPELHGRFEAIRKTFSAVLSLSQSHPRLLEIGAPGVSKKSALETLAAALKISPQDCAAAGDAENDLGMLAWAGVAVTVENAIPEAKRLARFIAPSCDDAGMADAIAWLLIDKAAAAAG